MKYFIIYICINAAAVPIIYFFFPETSGRTLEELDLIFRQSKNIWDPVKIAKKMQKEVIFPNSIDESYKIDNIEKSIHFSHCL